MTPMDSSSVSCQRYVPARGKDELQPSLTVGVGLRRRPRYQCNKDTRVQGGGANPHGPLPSRMDTSLFRTSLTRKHNDGGDRQLAQHDHTLPVVVVVLILLQVVWFRMCMGSIRPRRRTPG